MYLPKSKYKPAKYTQGDTFVTSDKKVYIGWYFETYQKRYFSGKEPGNNNLELFPIEVLNEEPRFASDIIGPSLDELNKGFFYRYILSDDRNKKIVEVNKNKFDYFKNFSYINSIRLKWDLTSPIDNLVVNGYEYKGSAYKNEQTVLEAEKTILGISNFITNYSQYIM